MTRIVPILLIGLLAACSSAGDGIVPEGTYGPPVVELLPDSASAGVPRSIVVRGLNTEWEAGDVRIDFGEGVGVPALIVDSSFQLTAQVLVADDAVPGARDVTITWAEGQREAYLRDAFFVEQGSISLSPDRASLGDTVEVEITGWSTLFQSGHTIVSFGPEVVLEDVDVLSSSRIVVTLHVPHRSVPGPVDVAVYNPGLEVYTLSSGFWIDRDANTMTIDPAEAWQGQTLEARVYAEDASFFDGSTTLDLGTGVVTQQLQVSNSERLIAELRIGNNAQIGPRDVVVTTTTPQGTETRVLVDGFTVHPVEADPLRARVSLSYGISFVFDPEVCEFDTIVYASGVFYEPNDFPCPQSGAFSTLAVPPHYDLPGTGFTMSGGATDCPATKTFDAGPYVELVAGEDVVTLDRLVHSITGRITYRAYGLDIPDYVTDTSFALVTPGGDGGVHELPPWTIPDALRTLPRVYLQHGPDYCGLQQPLDEPMTVLWDPAETYDEADMYLYLLGAAQDEGVPIMMVYPWDDGEFTYSADTLSFFTDGPAMLLQNAFRQTRFDVPGSSFTNAGFAQSSILWRGSFLFVTQD